MKRVVFNVCGTRYESAVSVIESKPHSMLAMLLRHQEEKEEKEIFVQGDPIMFRWILYYYTSDILVSEATVGVPKEVWDREIDFYVLLEKEEKSPVGSLKRPLGVEIDEQHELASLAKKHMINTNALEEALLAKRTKIYKDILEHIIPRLSKKKDDMTYAEFIGRSSTQKQFAYPLDYPYSLMHIDFNDIDNHFDEFVEYAAKIGFTLTKESYFSSTTARSNRYTIAKHDVKTAHQSLCIGLKIKD
jgi:hypothetical protein